MYLLTRKNRVIDYCSDGYIYVGNVAVCESKGTSYEDATIVYTDKELPADIDCLQYDYINGEFIANSSYGELSTDNTSGEFESYWEANEEVQVGDIRVPQGRENSGYIFECIQAGTTGNEQPVISEATQIANFSSSERIGHMRLIFNLAEKEADEILACGVTYSRATYSELWNYVQQRPTLLLTEEEWQAKYTETNGKFVPYYSSGNGTTTFRTPLLGAYTKGAVDSTEVGLFKEAGLPNITGSWIPVGVSNHSDSSDPVTGAFTNKAGDTVTSWGKSSSMQTYGFDFDASRSNPIYGNSDTVTPNTMTGIWVIKAIGIVVDTGSTDLASILESVQNTEERFSDYTDNVTYIDSFIVETWRSDDGLSWYRKYSDGWIEQGGTLLWSATRSPGEKLITLNTPFATDTYSVNLETLQSAGGTFGTSMWGRMTTQFYGFTYGHGSDDKSQGMMWHAYGY